MRTKGIHHISSIVWHAQENLDFYAGVLGLKLVKKTVNFDDSRIYHTTFGNDKADLGTLMTFFPWKRSFKEGVIGDGQVFSTTFVIPKGSLIFWKNRLTKFKIYYNEISRFNQIYLTFKDPHGINLELVEDDFYVDNLHEFNGVTKDVAIKGIIGATLYSHDYEKTRTFFTDVLGFKVINENNFFIRFMVDDINNQFVDLYKNTTVSSKMGAGTTHHIAFTVSKEDLWVFKALLEEKGYENLEIKPRKYFDSIYFREPGGVLIELATDGPGMLLSENTDEIIIPPHFEHLKEAINEELMPIFVKEINELVSYNYEDRKTYEDFIFHKNVLEKINYYAKESKTRELTKEELLDRDNLRKVYVKLITGQVRQNLENISIEDVNGEYKKLEKKKE